METRYTVRQAMEMIGVKAYVLRYWEDELDLKIHRNEMGHRYYTGYDIQLFMNINELKKRGLQLRAIKELIPKMNLKEVEYGAEGRKVLELSGNVQEVPLQDENHLEHRSVSEEKILEFQSILERLITQELQAKNEEEERCRSLDLAIRRQQMARKEAAAAEGRKNFRKEKHT